jgi:O-antigen ligase
LVTNLQSRPAHPLGTLRAPLWLARQLLSFEAFFLLFLYGIHIRQILPPMPGNEAFVFGAITMAMGGWIVIRDGLYVRGVPILLAGLAFTGWMILSIGWTPSRIIVWDNLRFILAANLWALFAGACIIAASRERVIRLLVMIMLLALLLAVIGIYIELVYGSFRFYRYHGGEGEWAVRDAYLTWGYIISGGAAMAFALAIFSRFGSLKQLVALAIFGVCVYFLLVNGARGPLLGTVAAALLATVVHLPRIGNNRIELAHAQLLGLGIVVLGIVYVGYLVATDQSIYTLNRFLTLFEEADDPLLRRGANRFDQFAGAYRLWLDAPVFGHGLAGFYYLFGVTREIPGNHPHNIILQILVEFGIIGLVFFALFMASGLRHFTFRRLKADPLALAVFMVFTTILTHSMVAGDIAQSYRFFFLVGLFALRPPPEEDDEEEEEEEEERR